ncbi:hypothetical protein [Streptosporangium pseudovulgare]|uniref:Adhesin domain-containing protein n=1 Tax=Streptosporangium pseudovulgare TaxID=35765 RepID=A0ABQ2QYA4_9ACTN|nr:hypothetical protein [Streptosporangium pseudovulgare]GGQ04197.1 hypothetical protein GCM10010140_37850 [Streptosporangium pseudovulgare]
MTVIAAVLLATGLVVSGCEAGNAGVPGDLGGPAVPPGGPAGPERHETVSYDVADPLTGLRVATGGTIEVTETSRSGAHVTESLRWTDRRPVTRHPVLDGTLTLDHTCPPVSDGIGRTCVVDYRVEIPRGLRVRADSGAGPIGLHGLSGPVEASSGAGDVVADGLTGRQVAAATGAGAVRLGFAGPPDAVDVRTGTGDGVVRLPPGTYRVVTGTATGLTRVAVADDPASPRLVRVLSGTGNIDVSPA